MMKQREKILDMTEGSVRKNLLLFSVPLLIGNLFQQLYNTVDSIVVGTYIGKEALAAVGSSNSLINLLVNLFVGVATGAGVLISQYYGAKNKEKMQWAVHTAMTVSILGGLLLTAVGIILTPAILRLMETPDDVIENSILYLRIFFAGSLFNVVYNMTAGILRGVGDSRRPLYYLGIASVVNIVLDVFLVRVCRMGVDGVAYATITSQAITAILATRALMKDDDIYRLDIKKLKIDGRMLKRILNLGIPSGVQGAIISLSNVIVQSSVNVYGSDVVAGYASLIKIDGFVVLPIMSFGMAAMTSTGQNFGAAKVDRVKEGIKSGLLISCVYTIVVSLILYTFGMQFFRIFSPNEPLVVEHGYSMMKILMPFYLFIAVAQIVTGVLRGAGKAVQAMILMIGSMVGVRLLWVIMIRWLAPSLEGVLWGYPVSWLCAFAATSLYLWKGKWLKASID